MKGIGAVLILAIAIFITGCFIWKGVNQKRIRPVTTCRWMEGFDTLTLIKVDSLSNDSVSVYQIK